MTMFLAGVLKLSYVPCADSFILIVLLTALTGKKLTEV